jgi:hypothetical protein
MRIFLCLFLVIFTIQAESKPNPSDTDNNASIHSLPPEKLEVIRLIGRNVLLSKESVTDESSDKEQISQLRNTVDKLIATETQVSQLGSISLASKTSIPNSTQQNADETSRKAARTHAWDIVSKLRQDASQLRHQNKKSAKVEEYSGGFPVGEQHGRLFDTWANKLEATLSDNNTDRLSQLRALRDQLKTEKHGVINTPLAQKTPTIQAMPWEEPEAPNPKKQRKIKPSQ